jgi:single-stranded DNA-specific DHH superfamily exonuclease
MNMETLEELSQLQPLGQGNPKVQLIAKCVRHHRSPRRLGREQQHAKMWVTSGSGSTEVIWWNCNEVPLPEGEFDIAFEPQINRYNGRESVLLKLLDWQPSASNGY